MLFTILSLWLDTLRQYDYNSFVVDNTFNLGLILVARKWTHRDFIFNLPDLRDMYLLKLHEAS